MKVLLISTDRLLFDPTSAVAKRFIAYGKAWGTVDVVVLGATHKHPKSHALSESVTLYAAHGRSLLGMIRAVLCVSRVSRPDVVVAQEPSLAGLVALFARAPLLVELHTDVTHPIYRSSLTGKLRSLIIPFVLKRARLVRVVSESVRDAMRMHIPNDRMAVLPIAVDVSRLSAQPLPERPTILMVTRFTPEKDVATGLRVLEHLIPRIPDVHMIIVGTGPDVYAVAARTRQFGNHLTLRGFVHNPFNEIGAHVFLHTTLVEGYGMALVEAGAVGMPIVTTDVGIAREVYGPEVTLAHPKDAATLADACAELLTNENARTQLSAYVHTKAHAHAESFDRYVEAYTRLVSKTASV